MQKEDSQFLTKELSLEQIKTELSKIPETIRQAIESETTSNEMKETIEKFEKRERERIQLAIKYLQLIEELRSEWVIILLCISIKFKTWIKWLKQDTNLLGSKKMALISISF